MNEILSKDSFSNEHHYALEKKRLETIGAHSYSRFKDRETERFDMREELASYIDTWDSNYLQEVEEIHGNIETEPLSKDLKAYIIIPVAAAQERYTLKKTLEQYAHQDADPSTWAIFLYLNHVTPTSPADREHMQAVENIISEFQERYPHLGVRVTRKAYEEKAPPIGGIKGEAWDVALYDVMQSGVDNDNLIGITHDADAAFLSSNYVSAMVKAASEVSSADIFTGYLEWHKDGDPESDMNRVLRYWSYATNAYRLTVDDTFVHTSPDSNAGIRFGTYAAISGFNKHVKMAEVHDLQRRISVARRFAHYDLRHFHYIDTILLSTNSRRIYETLAQGFPPDNAWRSLPFTTGYDPVRNVDTRTLANTQIPSHELLEFLADIDTVHFRDVPDGEWMRDMGRIALNLPL